MPNLTKPVLIFDGKCGFCRIWIDYWKQLTGDLLEYAPSQEVADQFPKIPPEAFKRSVQLVMPSGEVAEGAHAVFRTLALQPSRTWPLWLYRNLPGFAAATEWAYRLIASNRDLFYALTVAMFGKQVEPLRYDTVAWLFRKALAILWLIAFLSFGFQASGLIGSLGVQPAALYLDRVAEIAGGRAWHIVPTVFWFSAGDVAIQAVWMAGAASAVLAFFGVLWRAAFLLAFVLYLSLMNASQEFLGYQWDALLLEASFLAVFLGWSRGTVWLFRWLLFRLIFLSGAVKLLSGDPEWRGLQALMAHYQTQPLPTPLAWYAHQAPDLFQRVSTLVVLAFELVVPLFIFAPRRARRIAAAVLAGFQVLILFTGNYAHFNWLAIALCLFLLDDAWLLRRLPERWRFPGGVPAPGMAVLPLTLLLVLSATQFVETLSGYSPPVLRSLVSFAAPFGLTSGYGLFATMTTRRPEILIEGSQDGESWVPYEFRYKPGRLDRPPPWVAPHQPRLDWQMWFAGYGVPSDNIWLFNLLARLLEGEPDVLRLMGSNPFPASPPTYVRAVLFQYHFTDWSARSESGKWWRREELGVYIPPVSLSDLSTLPVLQRGGGGRRPFWKN